MSEPLPGIVPDIPSVLQGWRAFDVPLDRFATPLLWSVSTDDYWPPCQAAVGECSKQCGDEGPKRSCTCGLHAATSLIHLQSMEYHRFDVIERPDHVRVTAVVALWGHYVEGRQGWRARYGYPRLLFVPYSAWYMARPLADEYRIPFRLADTLKRVERRH